jgi:hypothetical protein
MFKPFSGTVTAALSKAGALKKTTALLENP